MQLQDEEVLTEKVEGLATTIHMFSRCRVTTDLRLATGQELALPT